MAAMRFQDRFSLGQYELGRGGLAEKPAPCFIIAEAGVNHNGSVDLALRLIEAAEQSGAHAVKFQAFAPDTLLSVEADFAPYQRLRTAQGTGVAALFEQLALPDSAWARLKAASEALGLVFLVSPFDAERVRFLADLGVQGLKLASSELTNPFVLEPAARSGLPILLSTGMASLQEIEAALAFLSAHGAREVALLHCVSSYPAPPESLNLRAIPFLATRFGLPVGFSDHTLGAEAAGLALSLGAQLIEKHFTLDRDLPGPDHAMSLDPAELAAFVQTLHRTESMLGLSAKQCHPVEVPIKRQVRRSLAWVAPLEAGLRVSLSHLTALRPETGLSPLQREQLVGRTLCRPVRAGELVVWDDFEPL